MSNQQSDELVTEHNIDLERLVVIDTSDSERSAVTGVYGALSKELQLPAVAGDEHEFAEFRKMAIERLAFVFGHRIKQIEAGDSVPGYPRLALVGGMPVVADI